jgi:hypothetical protein
MLGDNEHKNFNGKYLGPISLLPEILEQKGIDEVFLALPNDAIEKTDYVIDVCEKKSCRVNVCRISTGWVWVLLK